MASRFPSGPSSGGPLELQVGLPRLDLADAYLAASALLVGPATIASFDADLDAIDGVERLVT